MRIALNVNRSRITLLGFNLALLFFLVGSLLALAQQFQVRAVWAFLPTFTHVAIGFSLTLGSILLILIAQRFDEAGSVGALRFSCGELLTYIALAQTLSAGLQLFVGGFALTFRNLPAQLDASAGVISEVVRIGQHLTGWIHLLAAIVWFGVTYFVPASFLVRAPLSRRSKLVLGLCYVIVLMVVLWISSTAYYAHARVKNEEVGRAGMFVRQLWQPLLWSDISMLEGTAGTKGALTP